MFGSEHLAELMAKFSGVVELFRAMRAIPQACGTAIESELVQGADAMVARAKQLVHHKSGKLAATIHKTVERGAASIRVTISAGDKNSPEATWLEFGHRLANLHQEAAKFPSAAARASRSGSTEGYVPAHPFFFPAYHQIITPMKRRLGERIGVSVEQAARQG